ncbi:Hypothetical predicted protein [Mytilus galloprovincialis]|uniref:Reverse transcriptase domain-containing protein n=1 Tax=Mytilus galloprovincialis TaxID=29158 RepID=A0A8B6CHC3_MYTGA|nr:Hypothetical predicted protein [Mytilus galloprovincialis]
MKASTPINIEKLEHELQNHPDINFRSYLINGLRNGFDSMVKYDTWDTKVCKNNYSARSQSTVVSDLIKKECEKGFVVSPLGVATGKYSDKKRLILDLSSPHNDECLSVNDMIDKSDCSMSYVKIDDAIRIISKCGRKQWKSMYYFYVRLTFGCRSSPKIFDTVSQAVCYIAEKNYKVQHILHLLDDFLTIDHPDEDGERTMAIMMTIFKRLNIPIASHKTVGPTTCLEYLGIILDSQKMETRLPDNKVQRICNFIRKILHKSSCTKRELLQLLGHLNFASRVILPGRSFVSYLINLSTTVKDLSDFVHLSTECRTDLDFWLRFLSNWNGITMFHENEFTSSFDMELFTDAASTIGFGGFFRGKFFYSTWPLELPSLTNNLSIAFLELYPIVVAALLWGPEWSCKRILFWCDNEATVAIVKKGRSKTLEIMKLMRQLTWCAAKYNFYFSAKHVPGYKNQISDALSRLQITRFHKLAPKAEQSPCIVPSASEVMWH